jgi:hypothetical protein
LPYYFYLRSSFYFSRSQISVKYLFPPPFSQTILWTSLMGYLYCTVSRFVVLFPHHTVGTGAVSVYLCLQSSMNSKCKWVGQKSIVWVLALSLKTQLYCSFVEWNNGSTFVYHNFVRIKWD